MKWNIFQADQVSVLRTLQNDELFNFYYGEPLSVYFIDPDTGELRVANLGPRQDHGFALHIPRGMLTNSTTIF